MARAQQGAELAPVAHEKANEMASNSLAGLLTNRNHREPTHTFAAKKKDGYASVQLDSAGPIHPEGEDALNDDFYDEQLRSDGWHLDETSDDEQLDFSLPKALPSRGLAQSSANCECAPNAATLRRIRTKLVQRCAIM